MHQNLRLSMRDLELSDCRLRHSIVGCFSARDERCRDRRMHSFGENITARARCDVGPPQLRTAAAQTSIVCQRCRVPPRGGLRQSAFAKSRPKRVGKPNRRVCDCTSNSRAAHLSCKISVSCRIQGSGELGDIRVTMCSRDCHGAFEGGKCWLCVIGGMVGRIGRGQHRSDRQSLCHRS